MTINGKKRELKEPITIMELIRSYMLNRHVVIIQINGKTIPKNEYDYIYIHEEDEVIFTPMVCGG